MISIDNETKINYPITVDIPEDYWTITTMDGSNVEYTDGNN
tara:strand:+ start:950 stop:1072 length:123 start_codon:yes stop_codon:yes gene_type:complete